VIEKIKEFFSEKLHFFILGLLSGVAAVLFGKIVHDNRKRTEPDRIRDKPTDDESRRADIISKEAGESAQSISDIIKRVREREQGAQVEG
jgi:hypothetical protein